MFKHFKGKKSHGYTYLMGMYVYQIVQSLVETPFTKLGHDNLPDVGGDTGPFIFYDSTVTLGYGFLALIFGSETKIGLL